MRDFGKKYIKGSSPNSTKQRRAHCSPRENVLQGQDHVPELKNHFVFPAGLSELGNPEGQR